MDRGKKKIKQLPLQIPILNYVVGIYQNSCNSWNKRGFDDDADCCASVLKVLAQKITPFPSLSLSYARDFQSSVSVGKKIKKSRPCDDTRLPIPQWEPLQDLYFSTSIPPTKCGPPASHVCLLSWVWNITKEY